MPLAKKVFLAELEASDRGQELPWLAVAPAQPPRGLFFAEGANWKQALPNFSLLHMMMLVSKTVFPNLRSA